MTLTEMLDSDRGRDNGGYGEQRPTLRSILTRASSVPTSHWAWLAELTDGALRAHRAGCWDANELDHEEAACWELRRREQGLTAEQARALLWPGAPRCYACEGAVVGKRDRRPEGGELEHACARHADPRVPFKAAAELGLTSEDLAEQVRLVEGVIEEVLVEQPLGRKA
jgi:hypothetical protein